jgi:pilus assembly protein CpaF
MEDSKFVINGSHRMVNNFSESLCKRLLENGMPIETINRLKKGGLSA